MSLTERVTYAAVTPLASAWAALMHAGLRSAVKQARAAPAVPEMLEERAGASVPTPSRVAPDLELDYLEHRSAAYVKAMVWISAREFAAYVAGTNAPESFSDADLAHSVLSMAVAAAVHRDDALNAWVLDVSLMHQMPFYAADRMEITRFVFDIDAGRYELHDTHGRVHVPGSPLWMAARNRLVAQMCIFMLITHAWTHFWLPDAVAAKVHEDLPRDTNLYRLLAPHTRFTNRHNYAGLWVQRASDNAPTARKRLVPWLVVPAYKDDLRQIFTDSARRYYGGGNHFDFPDRMDRRIPYWDFLGAYWEVMRAFVERLAPSLEREVYEKWAQSVDRWFPGFAAVPMERALAVILWQMGIAHGVEHKTYVNWALRFGHADFSRPIAETPSGEISGYDRYRLLSFVNSFVDYRPPPSGLDLRLVTAGEAYGFAEGSAAWTAAQQFKKDLVATDARLQQEGRALLPLDSLIRTICF